MDKKMDKNRLAEIRKEKGWTQAKLARMLGISRTHLSDIENNKHEAAMWMIIEAARLLGVRVAELCGVNEQITADL